MVNVSNVDFLHRGDSLGTFLSTGTVEEKINQGCVYVYAKLLQSCPPLCDLMDCGLPSSSDDGIGEARILKWVAMPFSRGSS